MWRGTLHSWSTAKVLPTAASTQNFLLRQKNATKLQKKVAKSAKNLCVKEEAGKKLMCRTGGIKKNLYICRLQI